MAARRVDPSKGLTNPRVLLVYGSPRRGGNTDLLMDRVAEGARFRGALVERLIVAEHAIRPCTGCEGCAKKGRCALDDAMQGLYPQIERAHRLVVGSPVYFYGVTAQMKAWVDRCQVYWSRKYLLRKPIESVLDGLVRRGYVVSVAASSGERVFDGVILTLKVLFDALNLQYGGGVFLRGLDARGAVRRQPRLLEEAYELGCKVAKEP